MLLLLLIDEGTAQCERMVADEIIVIDEETAQFERMVADNGTDLCGGW